MSQHSEDLKKEVYCKVGFWAYGAQYWHSPRRDKCGNEIRWENYGQRSSQYGWEIDHIVPPGDGDLDSVENYQPLKWRDNLKKSDDTFEEFLAKENKKKSWKDI